jgi:hypothetical protein
MGSFGTDSESLCFVRVYENQVDLYTEYEDMQDGLGHTESLPIPAPLLLFPWEASVTSLGEMSAETLVSLVYLLS